MSVGGIYNLNGILNIYKPEGLSSNYIVQKIKKKFHISKVGHGGTLDPFAVGVLPIFINRSTKLDTYMHLLNKDYIACLKLGAATNTGDYTGKIVKTAPVPFVNECKINNVLKNFIGEINQVPPAFSAKKVKGKRAYSLARNGEDISLKPITTYINSCKLLYYNKNEIFIKVTCGSGTYIRTLCEDIAKSLDTVGYTASLERTRYGPLEKSNAICFDDLYNNNICSISKFLLTPDFILYNYPMIIIDEGALKEVLNGVEITKEKIINIYGIINENNIIRVYEINYKFIGIGIFHNNKIKMKSLIHIERNN